MKKVLLGILLFSFVTMQVRADETMVKRVKELAREVYGNVSDYQTDKHMQEYVSKLRKVQVSLLTEQDRPATYENLSQVFFFEKYNPGLKRDNAETFNPKTFNPLKYAFDYTRDVPVYYRVDGTAYFIIINP